MHSMTGYGQFTFRHGGACLSFELACVNSRQLDLRFNLPRELAGLEPVLRRRVGEVLSRGALTVTLRFEPSPDMRRERLRIDFELATAAMEQVRELARRLGLPPQVSLDTLLTLPGIVLETEFSTDIEAFREVALQALDGALAALRNMQAQEGEALAADLAARCAAMRRTTARIREQAPAALIKWRDRLRERLDNLGEKLNIDDEKLAREVAVYAERSDVTEELVRIESHLDRFAELLDSEGPVGRTLAFLCRELNREVNTLGAKTRDTEAALSVLELNSELGRIREQAANIE
ncbi:MAG: YicC family protein [Kiritimatiellaeota bacterium]|nr:YicC family protein [Kiritimatiellota bacterium]